jgi:hypothetical protein
MLVLDADANKLATGSWDLGHGPPTTSWHRGFEGNGSELAHRVAIIKTVERERITEFHGMGHVRLLYSVYEGS